MTGRNSAKETAKETGNRQQKKRAGERCSLGTGNREWKIIQREVLSSFIGDRGRAGVLFLPFTE